MPADAPVTRTVVSTVGNGRAMTPMVHGWTHGARRLYIGEASFERFRAKRVQAHPGGCAVTTASPWAAATPPFPRRWGHDASGAGVAAPLPLQAAPRGRG